MLAVFIIKIVASIKIVLAKLARAKLVSPIRAQNSCQIFGNFSGAMFKLVASFEASRCDLHLLVCQIVPLIVLDFQRHRIDFFVMHGR